MRKRPHLYVIREPAARAASNVIQINTIRQAVHERAWRDLVRRLEKTLPQPSTPAKTP